MIPWYRSRGADLGLRAVGMSLCAVACFAISRLLALAHSPGALTFNLALAVFLGASAGSAMSLLGNRLFDQIEVSSRWQHRSAGDQFSESYPVEA